LISLQRHGAIGGGTPPPIADFRRALPASIETAESVRVMPLMEAQVAEWNGETIVVRHDKPSGAWIFIAIHSTHLGPAVGGTRMKSYQNVQAALNDAMRLGEGMTFKFAACGMSFGGAKAVIYVPEDFDCRSRAPLLQRYGALLRQLGGLFRTGPDMGTTPADMNIIATTGAPYIVSRTEETGGAGDPGPYTARGVFTGIELICERLFGEASVKGRKVLVQGAGDVGASLIGFLHEAGAEVLFSEVSDSRVRNYRDKFGLCHVPSEAVYSTDCDIFAPCALGGILNADTIPQLKCRAVAGSANNQLERQEDAERLHLKNILYAPDYVINVGGVMAILGLEILGWTREKAESEVVLSIRRILRQIIESAAADGMTTEAAARKIAAERLHAAASPARIP
jgi:leucine dehydrogenase